MTRINVGILPQELTDKHLLAEHREIKRIPNIVSSGRAQLQNIPETFRLGVGHVKFFYDKLGYLLNRYKEIYKECTKRNFNVVDYSNCWDKIPEPLMNDYNPSVDDRKIVLERLCERDTYYKTIK